jgi:hypothetical protein
MMKNHVAIVAALMLLAPLGSPATPALESPRTLKSPTAAEAAEPYLVAAPDGHIYLSWVQREATGHSLRYARCENDGWSDGVVIAQGDNWFVNWADFPSIVFFANGAMAAHWLQKSGEGTYAYDVRVSRSQDGRGWRPGVVPHTDGTQTEHGFVSMLPWKDGNVLMVWLDGRATAAGGHGDADADAHGGDGGGHGARGPMTLRGGMVGPDGNPLGDVEIDGRVCDCCQTAGVLTTDGALFAYRDRSPQEIRDISYVRYRGGRWSKPATLHDDGWEIAGCPVNGPALASENGMVVAAWFTMSGDAGRVNAAFSADDGERFGDPIRVDDGDPLGRVDVITVSPGIAMVSWLEAAGQSAEIRFRFVDTDGTRSPSQVLTQTDGGRASGFPVMARMGKEIVFAWTEAGERSTIHTARMILP